MDDLKRLVTLVLAATIAVSGVVGYVVLTWESTSDVGHALSPSDAEWARQAKVGEVCCIFFGLIYWSGRVIARVLKAKSLADEIKARSRWHMGVLHLMLGSTILLGRGFILERQAGSGLQNGVMIGVGTAFMVIALVYFLRGPRINQKHPE